MGRLGLGVVALTVFLATVGTGPAVARTDGSIPAPAQIVQLATHVPVSTLNRVGAGDLARDAVCSAPEVRQYEAALPLLNGKV